MLWDMATCALDIVVYVRFLDCACCLFEDVFGIEITEVIYLSGDLTSRSAIS